MNNHPEDYQHHFQDDEFWSKAQKLAARVGRKVLEPALSCITLHRIPTPPPGPRQ